MVLQKDGKLKKKASDLVFDLKKTYVCEFDDSGNIGQMYRRQDEIGTPFCVTIDYQTIEDETVTVRDRDTMKQERVNISQLRNYLLKYLSV
ncbi:MAG: Glycine-tRNA ligase [Candidatus Roizmanbacteria bacterium GW2011_GWA2_34_18]|uniref:Glycine-tRNA ligase n=1 Tax=Candidatus Roizmanbacteria bacterium GW2011_GWA2_34_18 TaxID=1618477 RepID=A0A0G0AVL4_9BACT|nr:MAG: Glycine-tRNA ligase [Candidatus Roizmanbacteria bacterium GW2011_GWA2_34_18]